MDSFFDGHIKGKYATYNCKGPIAARRGASNASYFCNVTYERGIFGKGFLSLPHTEIRVTIDRKHEPPQDEAAFRRESTEMLIGYLETMLADLKDSLKNPQLTQVFGPIQKSKPTGS